MKVLTHFKRSFGKFSARNLVITFLLSLSLIFVSQRVQAISGFPPTDVEIQQAESSQPTLIAAGRELNVLLGRGIIDNPPTSTVMRYYQQAADYTAAYNSANGWFTYITIPSTLVYRGFNPVVGNIYEAQLRGGGRARLRNYGSSGPWPTIDLEGHFTPIYERIKEFKFKYNACGQGC